MPLKNEIDVPAIASEIASGLVPAPSEDVGSGAAGGENGSSPPPSLPVGAAPAPVSPSPAALRSMPKAWKKEMEPHWTGLSPDLQGYIETRETESGSAIEKYRPSHENWSNLVSPFSQILSQNPNVNPVQVFQQLMHGHVGLLQGTPEQKVEIAKRLLSHYGVDLQALAGGTPSAAQPAAAIPPEFASRMQRLEQSLYQEKLAQTQRDVAAFFSDKKNSFAGDLEEDILKFIQGGKASSLQEAYEMAMWMNPAVREKVIAKQQEDAATAASDAAAKAAKARGLNVGAQENSRSPVQKKGSINDTIDAVVQKHYGTH